MLISAFGVFASIEGLQRILFRNDYPKFFRFSLLLRQIKRPRVTPLDLKDEATAAGVVGVIFGILFQVGLLYPEKYMTPSLNPQEVWWIIKLLGVALVVKGLLIFRNYRTSIDVAIEYADKFYGKSITRLWYKRLAIGLATISSIIGVLVLLGLIPARI